MKATTKKLLCLLAVLTLALSLAVPAAAASEPPTDCPACGAKNVVWMPVESSDVNVAAPSTQHFHGYLTEDIELKGANALVISGAAAETARSYCMYMGGYTITADGRFWPSSFGTLNIIGDGKIVRRDSANQIPMFQMGGDAALNVYGKVTLENQDPDVAMFQVAVGNKLMFENATIKTKTLAYLPKTTSRPPVVTVKAGDWTVTDLFTWHDDWAETIENYSKLNFAISGGTFNFEPKADLGKGNTVTIPEGYEVTSASGKWTVAKKAAPAPTPTPTPSNPKPSNPSTADNSALLLWTVLAITSGAALTIASKKRAVK